MTANASRFLFDRDFREPSAGNAKHLAEMQAAEDRGFARGLQEGRRQAEAETEARLAEAVGRLANAAGGLLGTLDAHHAAAEAQAMDFALALARKLAGEVLRRQPLAAIAEAARSAVAHLRGVPHLVVRVNEALVESVEPLVQRIARERGYEGRLVILGEPDLAPGDARLEWADGGVVRDQARIEEALAAVLAAAFPDLAHS